MNNLELSVAIARRYGTVVGKIQLNVTHNVLRHEYTLRLVELIDNHHVSELEAIYDHTVSDWYLHPFRARGSEVTINIL